MRRTWIKLYVDQCLRGSMIEELTPEQRWMFVGLLLLAGDSPLPGLVYRRKNEDGQPIGYTPLVLADTLGVPEESVGPGLARMTEKGKISIDPLGVIAIENWKKYQSEYERTKDAPSRGVQKYGLEGDVDRDVDVDVDKEGGITFDHTSRSWKGITEEDKKAWAEAYPACVINVELAKAGEWIIANPAKGKKSNYRRFLVNWLSRSQDRGGTRGDYLPKAKMTPEEAKAASDAELKRLQGER